MEMECQWSHGMLHFLKERFMECSDSYNVFTCRKCGMIAVCNPDKKIFSCRICKNITSFAEVRLPYACKLLLQEIQTMGTKCDLAGLDEPVYGDASPWGD
ncbi:DNA-directed RNA polymerase II subunit RPB2 [Tetrabaena socialis]|uniref:DNA-directed RNA polymerase n=1 Tax=Tetrabaena socialis TaxID=47790 RepID=A0A2J8AJ56_9CHLO|nr:DNA-directed RNA polymerase II subunit RPB2 [Tetrabaena socialis]|eukprot:PNH12543.1 DNA-directed RNA polymerase II subunit RPB2 [Tetrabaena socialis]